MYRHVYTIVYKGGEHMARQGKVQYNFYLDTIIDIDIIQGLNNEVNKTNAIKEALRYYFIAKKLYPDQEVNNAS